MCSEHMVRCEGKDRQLIGVINNVEDKTIRAEIILLDINTLKQVSDYMWKQVPKLII